MEQLVESLRQLGAAAVELISALAGLLAPWLPLLLGLGAWIAYWTLAVNWVKLREVLLRGGWIGLVLIGLVAVLVWGTVAHPGERHVILGLALTNYVGKTVYVTGLLCIMLLCGSVQLAGCCAPAHGDDEPEPPEPSHH